MLKEIVSLSIQKKGVVLFSVLLLVVSGIYCMMTIPRDAVPDITNNQVQVVTISPTLSPQEIERLITFPIELAMSNILNVTEIRSVSRFGLSVVTVVFKDNVPTLDARQLVNEQIETISGEIPSELGIPQLMPITTGLGEIFQYTLEVDDTFKDRYTIMELRTIQDWVVKRHLSGIPGIVEISSFGGELKQYEVAVDPAKLRALDLTIHEVYSALSANNQNTGGSYIEKYNNAYYIRSEGMIRQLDDINDIVIANRNGMPVCVKEIAEVRFGSAKRFGAMTKDGLGECVGGITLMLKGANATEVTSSVMERVEMVQKLLPEGVHIKPYLARNSLVNRNMSTVVKNLSEGALIVFIVLMLFLGNIRIGLIVASIIPLAMLFAFILMRLFGVSANLMSLGAIDFGIVIDGTIIIVESVMTLLMVKHKGKTIQQLEMERCVNKGTGNVVKSAFFSVLIILTVFFPILTLTGIEGKTFLPMAQTLIFAIIGALLLSITYIPAMMSFFLKKQVSGKENFSDRMMNQFRLMYKPILMLSLRYKYIVLSVCLSLLIGAGILFINMGGEFMPTLDEGDFAMQMTLPPGSSLTESIEISTRAQQVLMKNFPEIESTVAKIGTAEVPTDPMGVEDADIMIIMKPRDQWVTAQTRAEIVEKMKDALTVVTGATFNFSQPIQLRFNELMTGSKADIAVKLYGEDMDELYQKANEAAGYIKRVPGAADVIVEQAVGLPQLVISYNRKAIARYGLDIETLNTAIRAAYAGETAGTVYEGERRFDLVIRFDKDIVPDLNIDQIFIKTPEGQQVPLSELANVEFSKGPMMINRDATKRRIVVGINVRDADVESVVAQVKEELDKNITLKSGYYFTYGGQFENLKNAKNRLSIVIPIALVLIITLLFFTFNSAKYALLVFTSVPLSCIGGILALYIRDIPFSISAGVGFIALFGVAVLNGIVMLSHYIRLRNENHEWNIMEIIEHGSMELLRPVLMTGLVASLGFLPMAISNSAGSEMQRPLATVVIGGLLVSTILTLMVIPILYLLANQKYKLPRKRVNKNIVTTLFIICCLGISSLQAQNIQVNQEQAIETALKNHPRLKNASIEIQSAQATRGEVLKIAPTEFSYSHGQLQSAYKHDQQFDIDQSVGNLLQAYYENALVNRRVEGYRNMKDLIEREIIAEVKRAYQSVIYQLSLSKTLETQVELFERVQRSVTLQYQQGEITLVEKSLIDVRTSELKNRHSRADQDLQAAILRLKYVCYSDTLFLPQEDRLYVPDEILALQVEGDASGPFLDRYQHFVNEKKTQLRVAQSEFFPELHAGVFHQHIYPESNLTGWHVGVNVPLWFVAPKSRIKQAKLSVKIAENNLLEGQKTLNNRINDLNIQLIKHKKSIDHYTKVALPQSEQLEKSLRIQLELGEIDVTEFVQGLMAVTDTRIGYIDAMLQFIISKIEIELYK